MTWHVGAIMNEPQSEVLRFAAWYFEAGAHGMTLLFDNPDDPTAAIFDEHPNVTVVRCTPEFWERLGLSQDVRFPKRQNVAMTWAYRQCKDDWFLNVDADEFMYVPDGIDGFLKEAPPAAETIRVETAEVILAADAGSGSHYRLPLGYEAVSRVYGDALWLIAPKRRGMVGHWRGKSFIRCGVDDITLRQHWAQSPGGRPINEVVMQASTRAVLLHHVGDNYDVWRSKLKWRIGSRGFSDRLGNAISEALGLPDGEDRIRELYNELHGCDAERLRRLKAEDAYLHVSVGPDQVASEILGDAV